MSWHRMDANKLMQPNSAFPPPKPFQERICIHARRRTMHHSVKPKFNSSNCNPKPPRRRLHSHPIRRAEEWRKRREKTIRPQHQKPKRMLRNQLHANIESPCKARKIQSKAPSQHLQTLRRPNLQHHISRCRTLYSKCCRKAVQSRPSHQPSRTPNVVEPFSKSRRLYHPVRNGIP